MLSQQQRRILLGSLAVFAVGCSGGGGGGGGGGGSTGATTGIYGKVTTSNTTLLVREKPRTREEVEAKNDVDEQSVADCTVTAKELGGADTVLKTATSDSSGNYNLTGLDSSKNYRIVADCSGQKFSSVAKPSTDSTTRIATNPRSTLIAVMVVQAVLESLEKAVQGMPPAIQDLMKDVVKKALDNIVATVQAEIAEKIATGVLPDPTPTEATNLTSEVATNEGKSASDVQSGVGSNYGTEIPPSVTDSLSGVAGAAGAFPACDKAMTTVDKDTATAGLQPVANIDDCVWALAKMMQNVLGFPVGLALTNVNVGNDCSTSNTTLTAAFPNGKFESGGDVPTGYCAIKPTKERPDRNRQFDYSGGGGDHGGVIFTQTVGSNIGMLSRVANALLNDYKYTLGNLDQMVFGRSGSGSALAGLDGRVFPIVKNFSTGAETYYYHNGTSWVTNSWPTCDSSNWTGSSWSGPCSPSNRGGGDQNRKMDVETTGMSWANATGTHGSFASTNFATTAFRNAGLALKPLTNEYLGPIPSMTHLGPSLDESRIHTSYNPTGDKEFHVLYKQPALWDHDPSDGIENGCWDSDTSTPCLGMDGTTQYPAVIVSFTRAATAATGGYRRITHVKDESTTGSTKYYVLPVYKYSNGPGVWAGAFRFMKTTDGKLMRDEMGRERALFVVTDASQCGTDIDGGGAGVSLPAQGASTCEEKYVFNAFLDYGNCGSSCPKVGILNNTPVYTGETGTTPMEVEIQTELRNHWISFANNFGQGVLALDGSSGRNPIVVTLDAHGELDTSAPIETGYSANAASKKYYVGVKYECSGSGSSTVCVPDATGYYLVKEDGTVLEDATANNKWANGTHFCNPPTGSNQFGSCTQSDDWVKLVRSDLDAATGFDFDPNTSGTQSFAQAFEFVRLDQGPVLNPIWKCSGDAFYINGSASGNTWELNCNANDNGTLYGDVSFSNMWEYYRWVNDPNHFAERVAMILLPNPRNGYAFGNPEGAKSLISTAFNGWLDGTKSFTATTKINALQAFALLYLYLDQDSDRRWSEPLSTAVSGSHGSFFMALPMDYSDGSDDMVLMFNKVFGNGFDTFKQ